MLNILKEELVGKEMAVSEMENVVRSKLDDKITSDDDSVFNGETNDYIFEHKNYTYATDLEGNGITVHWNAVEEKDIFDTIIKITEIERY